MKKVLALVGVLVLVWMVGLVEAADLYVSSQYSKGGNTYLQNVKNKDLTPSSCMKIDIMQS